VVVPAGLVPAPAQVRLVVSVASGTTAAGTSFQNDWDLWVYPDAEHEAHDAVLVTSEIGEAVERAGAGDTVLLELGPENIGNDVALGFTPAFWNTAWTEGQAPHTLGVLHDPAHPVFRHFPTEGSTDWQWWEPLHGAKAMLLDRLPQQLRPIVQPIDTWFEARRLGVLFEANLGAGKIVVSSLNLDATGGRVAARQLRKSLLDYMASAEFAPAVTIEANDLMSVLR
jgi:hypothetical protein